MEFKSADALSSKINEYFSECEEANKPFTVSDLAFALGFDNRVDFLRNKDKCKASHKKLINRALLKIEAYTERKLFDKGCYSGAKYSLANNFKGWSDKPIETEDECLDKLDKILNELTVNISI